MRPDRRAGRRRAARASACCRPPAATPRTRSPASAAPFGERDCDPEVISLFRLGEQPVDLRERAAGAGRDLRRWRQHGQPARDLAGPRPRRAPARVLAAGILLCGQSAGAMCWFEQRDHQLLGGPDGRRGARAAAGKRLRPLPRCSPRGDGPICAPSPRGCSKPASASRTRPRRCSRAVSCARRSARARALGSGASAPGAGPPRSSCARRTARGQPRPAIDDVRAEIIELRQTLAARAAQAPRRPRCRRLGPPWSR